MALVRCPDCGKDVSSEAPACPGCGRPMKSESPSAAVAPPVAVPVAPPPKKTSGFKKGCLYVGGGVVAAFLVLAYLPTMLRGCGSPPPAATPAPSPVPAEADKDYKAKEAAAAAANKEADAKEAAFLKTAAGKIWQKHKEWGRETCETIAKRQTIVGMTAEQVRLAWGKPDHVNSTITGNHRSEQWVYGSNQYVYFEDGIMTSLQQSK